MILFCALYGLYLVNGTLPAAHDLVALTAPKITLVERNDRRTLSVSFAVHNRLPVSLDWLEVGFLTAAEASFLTGALSATLYASGEVAEASSDIFVSRQRVTADVRPEAEAAVTLHVNLDSTAWQPQAARLHLLNYGLADVQAAPLLALIGTGSAADELAACTAIGVLDDAAARLSARRRLAQRKDLAGALAAYITALPPQRPSQIEALRWLFAVQALGVLGGSEARQALSDFAMSPHLWRFDAALQVVQITRLTSSQLLAPIAFALPPAADRMADVVAAALTEAMRLDSDVQLPRPAPSPKLPPVARARLAFWAALVLASVFGICLAKWL